MLFTTANTNCRDVAQLQKDLIGNEGFFLVVSQRHESQVCPWEAGSITSFGLSLGVEVFYIRWKETVNSARTYMRAQGKREEFVTYPAVQSIPLSEFLILGRVSSTLVYSDSVEQSWPAGKCLQLSTLCTWKHSSITRGPNNWKRSFVKTDRSKGDWFLHSSLNRFTEFLRSMYSSLSALISSTKRTDS